METMDITNLLNTAVTEVGMLTRQRLTVNRVAFCEGLAMKKMKMA